MTETTPDQTTVTPTPLAWITNWSHMPLEPTVAVTQSVTRPGPPSDWLFSTPVSSAPTMPHTPCTPKTSSESSAPSINFRPVTPHTHTKPAMTPNTIAPRR